MPAEIPQMLCLAGDGEFDPINKFHRVKMRCDLVPLALPVRKRNRANSSLSNALVLDERRRRSNSRFSSGVIRRQSRFSLPFSWARVSFSRVRVFRRAPLQKRNMTNRLEPDVCAIGIALHWDNLARFHQPCNACKICRKRDCQLLPWLVGWLVLGSGSTKGSQHAPPGFLTVGNPARRLFITQARPVSR